MAKTISQTEIDVLKRNAPSGVSARHITQALRNQGYILPGDEKKSFFRKAGEAIISSEKKFGQSIAGAIAAPKVQRQLDDVFEQQNKIQTEVIKAIKEKEKRGEDTTRLKSILEQTRKNIAFTPQLQEIVPEVNKTAGQVFGEAGGVLTDILGASTLGNVGTGASLLGGRTGQLSKVAGAALPQTAKAGLVAGAKAGAVGGGLFGAAKGASESLAGGEERIVKIATDAGLAGLVGVLTGAVIGGATGAIGGKINSVQTRKENARRFFEAGADSLTTSNVEDTAGVVSNTKNNITKMLQDEQVAQAAFTGVDNDTLQGKYAEGIIQDFVENLNKKIPGAGDDFASRTANTNQLSEIFSAADETLSLYENLSPQNVTRLSFQDGATLSKDKLAGKAIAAGVSEYDVNVMKLGSKSDQAKFRSMFKTMEKATVDPRFTKLPVEDVGETFIDSVKHINTVKNKAGKKLGEIAKNLPTETKDVTPLLDDFYTALDDFTIGVNGNKLEFDGSRFAGTSSLRNKIQGVYNLLNPDENGAITLSTKEMHGIRQAIFEIKELSTNTKTSTKSFNRIAEALRKDLANIISSVSPEYKAVNKEFAITNAAMENIQRALGKDFSIDEALTSRRAGEIMNRMLGNSSAKPMTLVQQVEDIAKSTGYKTTDNLVLQLRFSDFLEDLFGTTQTRSLRGQVSRAGQDIVDITREGVAAAAGQPSGLLGLATRGINKFRGVTPEAQKKAVQALIGLTK